MFHVICLETGEPVLANGGTTPFVIADGRAAADYAAYMTINTGKKHQPRRIKSDDWKAREQGRFDRGEYIRLPWADRSWWRGSIGEREHFAHVSTEKDGMVAFTEDAEKGAADRQTRVRPGVYLTRYYGDTLTSLDIQVYARDFAGKYEEHELHFAKTPDEIEHVYVNGPRSCMAGAADSYDSRVHPVRVYGAGDLAVAYLKNDDAITARALCWPEKLVYGRVYGDDHRLCAALAEAGYRADHHRLHGARMLRIEEGSYLVAPYIDGCPGISDDGEYLRIGGDLESDSTSGLISLYGSGEYCPCCGDNGHDADDMVYIRDREETWCSNCTENHTYRASNNGEYYADVENVVPMANGEYWTTRHFERHGGHCEATGENYPADDLIWLERPGVYWCRDHFANHGFMCEECGEAFDRDDQGARRDHCEACSGEAPPRDARGRYRARQGRDDHADQLELDNSTPF